jgi:hypothetical protein
VEPVVKQVEESLQVGRAAVEPVVKWVEESLQAGRAAVEPVVKQAEKELHDAQKQGGRSAQIMEPML